MKRTESEIFNDLRDYLVNNKINYEFNRLRVTKTFDGKPQSIVEWVATIWKAPKLKQQRFQNENLAEIEKEIKQALNDVI